jgi:hypothetical protein
MVGEVACYNLLQPGPLFRDWLVHSSPEFLLEFQEPRPHSVAPGFPTEKELPPAVAAADEGKAQEVEGFRLPEAAFFTIGRCEAAKFDQTRLFRV